MTTALPPPITPTKITLELTDKHIALCVSAPQCRNGRLVIEQVPFADGTEPKPKTILTMRKHGAAYAKRFNIPFADHTA